MKKNKSVRYAITLKGIIQQAVDDLELAGAIMDDIELYMRRNGYNAIVMTEPCMFEFTEVEKGK